MAFVCGTSTLDALGTFCFRDVAKAAFVATGDFNCMFGGGNYAQEVFEIVYKLRVDRIVRNFQPCLIIDDTSGGLFATVSFDGQWQQVHVNQNLDLIRSLPLARFHIIYGRCIVSYCDEVWSAYYGHAMRRVV